MDHVIALNGINMWFEMFFNTLILVYIYDVNTVYTTCHAMALS